MALDLKLWYRTSIKPYLTKLKSSIATSKQEAIDSAKSYTDQEIATLAATVGSITGSYKGSFITKVAMDAVTSKNGDWAILSVDDAGNESGIYVKQSGGFAFVMDIIAFDELRTEILASDVEFATGTSTTKTGTVKQIKDALAAIDTVIGPLNTLTTTDKTSIVNAINEVKATAVNATAITNQDWVDGVTTPDETKFDTATNDTKVTTVGYVRLVFKAIVTALAGKAAIGGSATQAFLVKPATELTDEAVNANQFNFSISQIEADADYDAA